MLYKLTDAHEMHRLNPKTFQIPSKQEIIEGLKSHKDMFVKVCFEYFGKTTNEPNSERMWVIVDKAQSTEDLLTGELNSDPVLCNQSVLKCGDKVTFSRCHIYSVMSS